MNTQPKDRLRIAVAVWQTANAESLASFHQTNEAIHRELDAAGGYVTSSASDKGYCHSYTRDNESYSTTVDTVGEAYNQGPHAGKAAPYLPEAGDRCRELEKADRIVQMRAVAARADVERIVGDLLGQSAEGVQAQHVSLAVLALTLSEKEAG